MKIIIGKEATLYEKLPLKSFKIDNVLFFLSDEIKIEKKDKNFQFRASVFRIENKWRSNGSESYIISSDFDKYLPRNISTIFKAYPEENKKDQRTFLFDNFYIIENCAKYPDLDRNYSTVTKVFFDEKFGSSAFFAIFEKDGDCVVSDLFNHYYDNSKEKYRFVFWREEENIKKAVMTKREFLVFWNRLHPDLKRKKKL